MAIRLDRLKRHNPKQTVDNNSPEHIPETEYIYKDVEFDIEFKGYSGNLPGKGIEDDADIGDLKDIYDIKQSLTNLFNTKPGDRLTNPFFGLNLSNFVFEQVSTINSDLIGRAILDGVGTYEPRVSINKLKVIGYPDQNLYRISFILTYIDKHIADTNLIGTLNSDGFMFNDI
tara:strand:+ start:6574 stop:7092 length:519 start_codon:yes stop_codon:yes gene_type:complete